MECGNEQGDTSTTWANQDNFEMSHKSADSNPPKQSPSVPSSQPQWLRSGWFVKVYEGCVEQFPGRKTFMDEFRND